MVPNITSGSSFYGVIAYNKIKMDNGTAKVLWHLKIAADTSNNMPLPTIFQRLRQSDSNGTKQQSGVVLGFQGFSQLKRY